MSLQRLDRWALAELPAFNRAVLARTGTNADLITAMNTVLLDLPEPDAVSPVEAQRLVVNLGLAGVSVARHFQEQDPARKATPDRAFAPLAVGPDRGPFLDYFARLADRTATGHPHRDSYASLVRWNVPSASVTASGEVIANLPSVFDDEAVRTYTGEASERRFFHLLKDSETVERAVNELLQPISDGALGFQEPDGRRRVRLAAVLLEALRRLSVEFAALPPDQGLRPEYFLDVFRQFAVHWRPDDIPPSGALDPEALRRDLLLGIALPDYHRHVGRVWPALLDDDRVALDRLLDRPTMPTLLLRQLDVPAPELKTLAVADLTRMLHQHPVLSDWYLLLDANARAAGAHLMLSKKFLFGPQRVRDAAGLGDRPLVSNRRGTTGMDETVLERLTIARRHHELADFRRVPRAEFERLSADEPRSVLDQLINSVEIQSAKGTEVAAPCRAQTSSALPAPTPAGEQKPARLSRGG
jgi:hypothetical protein